MNTLKFIDNKEIIIEILHLAIDYLIGNITDEQTLRSSHKYGFQNADDFLLVIRIISKFYKDILVKCEKLTQFSCITPEMSRLAHLVLSARYPELRSNLEHWEFLEKKNVIESFVWDTRLILGDSSFGRNIHQLTTLVLQYRHIHIQKELYFEMNSVILSDFIYLLENLLTR
ncbi:uncharacterized protein LOC27207535 isoform X1 [Drosophila simulans]|uniref:Uncharacterized protein, isoform A n=2 Tax=Drosophila simulans TaxID=7240 RepID=A0A0J9R5H7_DROSI|nr:uncharacterized protein LOC27207535 isoform X1 [Drosophila simulans]KMY91457.1 uncharacterized protein Dsimw501_GD27686, isoform A [Drosophila simulans]